MSILEQISMDFANSIKEAETKQEELRDFVQKNLWSRYGRSDLKIALLEAEITIEQR